MSFGTASFVKPLVASVNNEKDDDSGPAAAKRPLPLVVFIFQKKLPFFLIVTSLLTF